MFVPGPTGEAPVGPGTASVPQLARVSRLQGHDVGPSSTSSAGSTVCEAWAWWRSTLMGAKGWHPCLDQLLVNTQCERFTAVWWPVRQGQSFRHLLGELTDDGRWLVLFVPVGKRKAKIQSVSRNIHQRWLLDRGH